MSFKRILMIIIDFVFINIISADKNDTDPFINTSLNCTSCEEFLANTTFDPKSIVEIDWRSFYYWNYQGETSFIVRFSLAYPLLIERFSTELTNLDPPVNWNRSVLFMESSADVSALFISTDVSGKFSMVSSLAFKYTNFKVHDFAMKLIYPGYLGFLNCKYRLGYAAAPIDQTIKKEDIEEIALKFGIKADFNNTGLEPDQTETESLKEQFENDFLDEDHNVDED